MKKQLSVLLAAALLLTLAACKKADAGPQPPVDPPVSEEPETPEPPVSPGGPEEPDEPGEPETPAPPAEPPEAGAATVTDAVSEGSVEELVSYQFHLPEITAGDASVSQILNDYYASVYGKLGDLCYGEIYEQAIDQHTVLHVTADYQVMYSSGGRLSILRHVTVTDQQTGVAEVTAYAETFNLENGGLLTAGDFFDADEQTYTARLVDCVRRRIQEDPYHDQNYFSQWEDLTQAAFSKDQFYVTDGYYAVFYQENDLGGAAETVFEIPWSQLEDLRK